MATKGRGQKRSAKILVIDDEALLRAMMCDALEAAGHKVVVASSGDEGLTLAKLERPDCIILDIMMPGRDGYETCLALKADPELAHIPVLMSSATTDLRVIDQAERVGALSVLPKPVPMEQLQHAVSLALISA
jgi:two-component system, sensor histidine kinase and response regulator